MNKLLAIPFVFILLSSIFSNYIKSDLTIDRPDGNYILAHGHSTLYDTRVFVCNKKNLLTMASLDLPDETLNSF